MSVMISRRQERNPARVPSDPAALRPRNLPSNSLPPKSVPPKSLPPKLLPTTREVVRREHSRQDGTLTVGRGIEIKGGIQSCVRLVVQGRVEATVEAQTLEVTPEGIFKGGAEVDDAEIAGLFDGNLTVRGLLMIHRNAKVSGMIRYSEICVETGGRLSGDIDVLPAIPVARGVAEA